MTNRSLICEVPVFFATSEGQTRVIARRIVSVLNDLGLESCAIDVAGPNAADIDWAHVRGALVGASIHIAKHQKAAERFVKAHAADLTSVPSAFFSVSLSAASKNAKEVEAAEKLAKALPTACGWVPARIVSVAGRGNGRRCIAPVRRSSTSTSCRCRCSRTSRTTIRT